jgi:hypothetical protein
MSTLWEDHGARHKSTLEMNMTPNDARTTMWRHKTPGTWTEDAEALRDKELYLNRVEDNVKGPHAEGNKSTIDREESGSETGRNGVPGSVCDALWPRCFSIICLCLRRTPHPSIHQRVANTKEKHREEADGRRESSKLSSRCLGLS